MRASAQYRTPEVISEEILYVSWNNRSYGTFWWTSVLQPLQIEHMQYHLILSADLAGFYFPLRAGERESKMLREVWDIFVLPFSEELTSLPIRTSSEALERGVGRV